MNRCLRLLCACAIGMLIAEPLAAQDGQQRGLGPGFRGGRGAAEQAGQGGRQHQGRGAGGRHGAGKGAGHGAGKGAGRGPGGGHDERHAADRDVFHFLLENHKKITRTVTERPDGVDTLTESEDPEIAEKIKDHVEWMKHRVEHTNPIRMRDPLFAEIFQHTDKIKMDVEETEKGVRVSETSEDPYVAQLIQEHAKVVSGFVARGFTEAMKSHPVPTAKKGQASPRPVTARPVTARPVTGGPVIADHGAVVRLPEAAHQPRAGTKLIVDVTRGGNPAELNSALQKVAKYLNIYAGGGAEPAEAEIAVIFHGGATQIVLNDDAYAARFQTEGNPNLELMRQLHEAGVELYVCGQTLISEGSQPEQVALFVDTAVSALTAVVNLQSDGYAYLPLGN